MKRETKNWKLGTVIPETRFSPANLHAEKAMHRRHELNASIDQLLKDDRGPWDSEHRRLHDALARKRKERLATAAGIGTAVLLYLTIGALAAKSFDRGADIPVCPSRTANADKNVCATFSANK